MQLCDLTLLPNLLQHNRWRVEAVFLAAAPYYVGWGWGRFVSSTTGAYCFQSMNSRHRQYCIYDYIFLLEYRNIFIFYLYNNKTFLA